jgi:hypothetical protein
MGLLFLIMGLSMFVGTLSTGLIFVGLLSLIFGLSMFVMALLVDRIGAVKRAFLQGTGLFPIHGTITVCRVFVSWTNIVIIGVFGNSTRGERISLITPTSTRRIW